MYARWISDLEAITHQEGLWHVPINPQAPNTLDQDAILIIPRSSNQLIKEENTRQNKELIEQIEVYF